MTNKYLAINFTIFGSIIYLFSNVILSNNQITGNHNNLNSILEIYFLSKILILIGYFILFIHIDQKFSQSINWIIAIGLFLGLLQYIASLLLYSKVIFLHRFLYSIASYNITPISTYISLYLAISLIIWGLILFSKKNITRWSTLGFLFIPLSFTNLMYYLLRSLNHIYLDYYFKIYNQIWFFLLITFCYMLPAFGLLFDIWKNRIVIKKG